jgi:MoCo/4Fe-4S cofactor protein with predicted Tat translocation signal
MDKKYWKSLEELKGSSGGDYLNDHKYVNKNEMADLVGEESLQTSSSRRDFLKLCGFSIAASALVAGCERPVQKAIPYLFKPEEVTPGMSNFYASTFFDGDDYSDILVKVRDGRPVKVDGNDLSPLTGGTAPARVQASVLGLYDSSRLRHPEEKGNVVTWEYADKRIREELNSIEASGGKTVILTGSVISPSTVSVINGFLQKYPGTEWVCYDPLSFSAMLEANSLSFGKRAIPSMNFDKADVVAGFGADFLGTWLMPAAFAGQYAKRRSLSDENDIMSRHVQFESSFSITGAAADERIQVKPSQQRAIIRYLYDKLAGNRTTPTGELDAVVDLLAEELERNRGRSIVVCGLNDTGSQLLVNGINYLLGNYASTLDLSRTVNLRQGDDRAVKTLVDEMNRGEISALFISGVNPVYDYPEAEAFASGMERVKLRVSMAGSKDETSDLCDIICPVNHFLESWGDAEPVMGHYSLQQPVIRPMGNTRQMQESLLTWSGVNDDYLSFLKSYWERAIFPRTGAAQGFDSFWNECLQRGVLDIPPGPETEPVFNHDSAAGYGYEIAATGNDVYEMEIVQSIAIGSGKHANNPWLQELPDPLSKACWDNYLSVSPSDASRLSLDYR